MSVRPHEGVHHHGCSSLRAAFFAYRKDVKAILVRVNGEELALAGQTLAAYLAGTSYDPQRIAVERNGEIVPRRTYGETVLRDGDVLEIVSFVGGG